MRVDEACVADAAAAGLAEQVIARHEIVVANAERGGQQAAHIDLTAGRKQHAIGVAKEHLAVGVELAIDLAGIVAQDAVECHCAAVGLHKVDRSARADLKALPVQRGPLAVLQHLQRVAAAADAGTTRRDLPALGQGSGIQCMGRKGQQAGERQAQSRQGRFKRRLCCALEHGRGGAKHGTGLAAGRAGFCCRNPSAAEAAPDESVNMVHAASSLSLCGVYQA